MRVTWTSPGLSTRPLGCRSALEPGLGPQCGNHLEREVSQRWARCRAGCCQGISGGGGTGHTPLVQPAPPPNTQTLPDKPCPEALGLV